jgi:hypothetical protein
MNKTFGEQFMESQGAPIEHGQFAVLPVFTRAIQATTKIELQCRTSSRRIAQGLRLAVTNAVLEVKDTSDREIVLWMESAPPIVKLLVKPEKGKSSVLKIWNVWRDERGTQQAWIGNAGLWVEDQEEKMVLHCSDGVGEPDFEDLVVELTFYKEG